MCKIGGPRICSVTTVYGYDDTYVILVTRRQGGLWDIKLEIGNSESHHDLLCVKCLDDLCRPLDPWPLPSSLREQGGHVAQITDPFRVSILFISFKLKKRKVSMGIIS